ncbi:hypothetical protein BLA29_012338 [Euroglyphus maynei]|uniref:Uncharacterized protein n=1 Tax=Euroglyphus maynei TaxID=6958 RepID=A0A1Y3AZ16_EURMA|nr:hypothetical protein BLA29_012338 [Euroglyphus maynei]
MKKFGAKVEQQQIDYYSVPPSREKNSDYTIPAENYNDEIYEIPVYDYDALETQLEKSIQQQQQNNANEYLEIKPSVIILEPSYETMFDPEK